MAQVAGNAAISGTPGGSLATARATEWLKRAAHEAEARAVDRPRGGEGGEMSEPTPTGAPVPLPSAPAEIPPRATTRPTTTTAKATPASPGGSAVPAIGGALDLATGLARLFGRLPRV